MARRAVVLGSSRPGRRGKAVADWVYEQAAKRTDAQFELVDVADFGLPLLDEPLQPSLGHYREEHTKARAEAIGSVDGYVFVTAEYNHSVPAALKNALDFLYREWNNKAAGFVSYGGTGGTRAVGVLRCPGENWECASDTGRTIRGPAKRVKGYPVRVEGELVVLELPDRGSEA